MDFRASRYGDFIENASLINASLIIIVKASFYEAKYSTCQKLSKTSNLANLLSYNWLFLLTVAYIEISYWLIQFFLYLTSVHWIFFFYSKPIYKACIIDEESQMEKRPRNYFQTDSKIHCV